MPLYEHVFLTRQDASAQQVEDLTAQFKAIIEQLGGKIAKTEQWGVKSLAYRLRKNRKAHFTLLNIDAPSAALNEIERQEGVAEDGGRRQEAAGAGARHQTRAFFGIVTLRDPLAEASAHTAEDERQSGRATAGAAIVGLHCWSSDGWGGVRSVSNR